MYEQRFQAYIELIDALLNCNDGVEPEILSAHEDIIDVRAACAQRNRFVQTMEQVAASLAEEGNKHKAYWLRDIAAKISEVIENSKSVATEEEYLDFLIEVLQAIEESEDNPEVVYPLLEANLEKLDENFAVVLQNWASKTLSEAEGEEALCAMTAITCIKGVAST